MSSSSPHDVTPLTLKRGLSFSDVFAYGLLYFVPMAPVAVFGIIYNTSSGMVALTYLLAAVAMIFSAVSYSEMAKKIPLAGSVYAYVSEGMNPFLGFVTGWAILLDYLLLPALLAVLGALALTVLQPGVPKVVWLLCFVLLPLAVNLVGIQMSARLSKLLLAVQLLVLAVFFVFAIGAIAKVGLSTEQLLSPFYHASKFSWSLAFAAVPIAALSFIGFDAVSTLNEEAKGGGDTVSKVTLLLLVVVTLLFMAQVYLAGVLVPLGTVYSDAEAETAFYAISSQVVGSWFLPIMTLTSAIVAILANALVSQATTAKLLFSMARDGRLPRFLAALNQHGAPYKAMVAVAMLSFVIAYLGSEQVELMVTLVTFGALTAYIMLNAAVILFFRRQQAHGWFKHGLSPLLGMLILGYALANTNVHAKTLGGLWLLLGLGMAWLLHRRNQLKNRF